MNLFSSLIITSNAARIYFTTVSVKDLTLSQVFCSDVLDSRHQLCVKLDFHFVGSSSVLCFLGKIKWPKSPLSSLMGLFLRLYTPLSIQYSIICVLALNSESPSRVCPIHFLFRFLLCAFIKALSSPILSINSIFTYILSN